MRTKFSIKKNETVTAVLMNQDDKLICQLYDSGFTSKEAVFQALIKKTPYYTGHVVRCQISTESEKWTTFNRRVNR